MIESHLRNSYQKFCVDPLLKLKLLEKIHPIHVTCTACFAGVGVLPLLALESPFLALGLLGLSGFLDTLDGSLARHHKKVSNKGAAIDILSDRIVEFAVILGLFLVDPATRALPCLLMLGSVFICVTSFLIVGVFTQNSSQKSFHYSTGLMERFEAFLFFAAMMVFPSAFDFLSYAFSSLVILTAFIRIWQFTRQKE